MHLLVIEDDSRMSRVLDRLLTADRHVVEVAITGRAGLEIAIAGSGLDAIVLDIGLPDVSGLDVARRLRANSITTPILMLTARDAVRDRVDGLDAGADDYLVKPFAYQELSARLRALVRRAGQATRAGAWLVAGPIALDEERGQVEVDGRPRATLSARVRRARKPDAPSRPGPQP